MDGTFTMFNGGASNKAVDVHNASCTKKQYPKIIKHYAEQTLCSNRGADGRRNDLEKYIHSVQIGWKMSAINRYGKINEMVCITVYLLSHHNTNNRQTYAALYI